MADKKIVKIMKRGYNLVINIPTDWSRTDKLKKNGSALLTRKGKGNYEVDVL